MTLGRPTISANLRVIAALGVAFVLLGANCEPHNPQVRQVHPYRSDYWFWNWDTDGGEASVPDNPVSIIFRSHYPDMVDRVYGDLAQMGLTSGGDKMNLKGYGPSRSGVTPSPWSSSSAGRKGNKGCVTPSGPFCKPDENVHVRTYGPDGQQGTQVYLGASGYYLVATVHFDKAEGEPGQTFGYHTDAREALWSMAMWLTWVHAIHWTYTANIALNNACVGYVRDVHHICDFDGYAWEVWID